MPSASGGGNPNPNAGLPDTFNGQLLYTFTSGASQQRRKIPIRCNQINYGVSINFSETESAKYKSIYFNSTIFDNFTLGLICTSHAEYEQLMNFCVQYIRYIGDGTNPVVPMLANVVLNLPQYPDLPKSEQGKDFAGIGVPVGGITYGDQVELITYDPQIAFLGASNLQDITSGQFADITGLNTQQDQTSFFYPSGTQLSTPATPLEETLFNAILPSSTGTVAPAAAM